jgi:hypothetical protein
MKNSDEIVERTLAALRDAKVPEGLEERVAAKVPVRAAVREDVGFRWREVLGGSVAAGVWWRGALSGAAVAMVVAGLVWMAAGRGHSTEVVVRERVVTVPAASANAMAVKEDVGGPCVSAPRVVRDSAAERRRELVKIARAEMEMSHPAPAMGLTAQERELVQLARNGDAKDLTALDPEMRAKAEAKDAAEFQRFFAEPARGDTAPGAAPSEDNQ